MNDVSFWNKIARSYAKRPNTCARITRCSRSVAEPDQPRCFLHLRSRTTSEATFPLK